MTPGALTLPEGRRGRVLALGVTLAGAMLLWLGAVAPLIGWYQARQQELTHERELAARMAALARELPALRREVAAMGTQPAGGDILLAGDSDAIAGANLQSAVQDLAARAGTSLDSAAMQPATPDGALRRISMQVSVTARWPVLVALLQAIDDATPRMILDGISLDSMDGATPDSGGKIQASFTIAGFRAGDAR
ncbi:type II secretion system protein GspM [Acidocella sp.]|uniref:type II secretion system protein GspM n=1 Tax=Acidocella sp. TaxID=50710 RepID=UPI003D08EA0E